MPKYDTNIKVGDQTEAQLEYSSTHHESPGVVPAGARRSAAESVADNDSPQRSQSGFAAPQASLVTALTGANNDLRYTAVARGDAGNAITVEYVDPATNNAALSVDVDENDITVNLATDGSSAPTSTAAQVRDAVNADAEASALVTAANAPGNDGTGVVDDLAPTALTGG